MCDRCDQALVSLPPSLSMSSNLARLTRAHTAVAAKRRAKKNQVKEVVFDEDARREFLTGFHKRKVARTDAARKKAMDKEKQQRQESRREQRQILREQAVENAANVEAAYGALINGEGADADVPALGPSGRARGKQREEFEDEETLATVTVVEDFDPDTLIHGTPDEEQERRPSTSATSAPVKPKPASKPKTSADKTKRAAKPKKIKYETNAARRAQTTKQRARRTEKAELAGGKRAHKNKSAKRR